jgi:cytoskeleton protein RodZ
MDKTGQEAQMPLSGAPVERSVGATLAAARVARGASVEDVSRALKLSVAQVKAIEADDHSQLPSAVFVRGFIRNYARLLNVNIMPMLPEKAPAAAKPDERLMHHRPGVSLEPRRYQKLPALLTGVTFVLLGLAYYEFALNAPPARPIVAATAYAVPETRTAAPALSPALAMEISGGAAPAVLAKAGQPRGTVLDDNLRLKKSADPASGANEKGLHFLFNSESWVEVRGKDGKVVFSMVNAPGSERIVRGDPPFSLVIGSASGVQLSYNGSRVDLASYVTSDVARLRLE